ncbi:MAG: SGNH/GDSL hydrolase family protein [Planctomycetota bacterium]
MQDPPPPPEAAPPEAGPPAADRPADPTTRRLRRKRWRRRAIAVFVGLTLPLFLVECGVRVLWSQLVHPNETPLLEGATVSLGRGLIEESLRGPGDYIRGWANHPLYIADDYRSLRLKPNLDTQKTLKDVPPAGLTFHVTTTAEGLRGPVEPPPPPNALRVLCVGDSMTFGEGVEDGETFPHKLQEGLAAALGRPVRAFNAGVISLGQQEQRDIVAELVPKLRPDLVLLQFTVANDVMDDWRWEDLPLGEKLRRRTNACETLEHHILLTNPLTRFSRAYRLGVWRWGRHAIRYRYMVERPNLERAARLLVGLRDLVRERAGRDVPVGVVIAPSVVQVERGLAETLLRTRRINDGVSAGLREAGVPVLDLLPGLRARADEGESLYIQVDRHWNAAGCAAAAELLVPFCRELLGA